MSIERLQVSTSPHIRVKEDVSSIMMDVIFALLPTTIIGIFIFGMDAFWVILVSVASAVLFEALFQRFFGKPITVFDKSSAVTGLLLALNLPSSVPLWLPFVGSGIAIGLGKQVFGGLGHNPFNPALIARVVLLISWPVHMTTWPKPIPLLVDVDAVTQATPMALLKEGGVEATKAVSYLDSFLGFTKGCIGEVSCLFLLIGAIYLLYKRHITWHVPFTYCITVAVLTGIFWGIDPLKYANPLFHILNGGLILGAFFMATDMVTIPLMPKGRVIFGIGCGILTVIIRLFGGYPEGVSFSILIMNAATPLIDRWRFTHPRRFGKVKGT